MAVFFFRITSWQQKVLHLNADGRKTPRVCREWPNNPNMWLYANMWMEWRPISDSEKPYKMGLGVVQAHNQECIPLTPKFRPRALRFHCCLFKNSFKNGIQMYIALYSHVSFCYSLPILWNQHFAMRLLWSQLPLIHPSALSGAWSWILVSTWSRRSRDAFFGVLKMGGKPEMVNTSHNHW